MKSSSPWRRIAQIVSGVILLSLVIGSAWGIMATPVTQSSVTAEAAPGKAGAAAPAEIVRLGDPGPYEKTGPSGPFVIISDAPTVFNGNLNDLQGTGDNPAPLDRFGSQEIEIKTPNMFRVEANPDFQDPAAQAQFGSGQMPDPINSFSGLEQSDGGGWSPPDTSGDVGPNHYVQNVNIAIGIYDKDTGVELVNLPFNSFFSPAPSPCNNQNRGDVVVIYDELADRWLVTDFSLPSSGPVYECIAISQTGDPVSGGWYYYAFVADADGTPWNDYPKLSVWPDAYYMTANMFDPWSGVYIWALNRDAMLNGQVLTAQLFMTGSSFGSLLPSNVRGDAPPADSPAYMASFDFPNTLHIWKLFIDWDTPGNSHLDGPFDLTTAPASMIGSVPQLGSGQQLDTLGDRMMFQLQYRNFGDYESLWVNHTVASSGEAGVRWYEVRDLDAAVPTLYQQGTYSPDDGNYRWMGSLAVDQDGNMALGYSVSSASMYPSVRYTGRLEGEQLGALLQGEASLVEGTGAQTSTNRWGDYSQMSVDPVDGCTFWYTQEYYSATGGNWNTRFGSFKFPSCGLPKGWISGVVTDAVFGTPLAGVPVVAVGDDVTFSAMTQADGTYEMKLPAGSFTLTAGPLLPVYPTPVVETGVAVTEGGTTTADFQLQGIPVLADNGYAVDDAVPGGNGNGFPEPGEQGIKFFVNLDNVGAGTATGVTAELTSLTAGVTVDSALSAYPDLEAGDSAMNLAPYVFTIGDIPCGNMITFQLDVTTDTDSYSFEIVVPAGIILPRENVFFDDMEGGDNGWTHGGNPDSWLRRTGEAYSPVYAWTDSSGDYPNNMNSWVRTPAFNLSGLTGVQLDFWHYYDFEPGWDYGYVAYSFNGTNWTLLDPDGFTGTNSDWTFESMNAAGVDNHSLVYFRFRSQSDGGVTADGWFLDDVAVSYQPYSCVYEQPQLVTPTLISPADGSVFTGTQQITLTWSITEPVTGFEVEVDGTVFTTTETSMSFVVLGGTSHTWRVRAYDDLGFSEWTEPWDFTVTQVYKLFLPVARN